MTLPFENDTTEIIRKIVFAQLKHDKLKKYLSIFAISLATFLMTAVLLLVSGIIEVNTNGGNSITGSYHALVSGLTKQQYEKLSADERIEKLGFNALVKSASYDGLQLNISCSNEDSLVLNGLSVSEGNMPQKKNEILVEKDYLSKQGIDAKIGDKIVLPGENNQEGQEFVISGYIKTSAKGTDRSLYAAIVSMEYFLDIDGWNTLSPMAMFRLKSQYASESEQIQNEITEICKEAGILQSPSINHAYLELSQPSVLLVMAGIAGLAIVIMAGVLVIYCIFYISIINSIREYGQLRTIGMTEKQIKRLVYKEGTSLSLIAIPIGLIMGTFLSYFLVPQGFQFKNLLWAYPIVILFSYMTVRLSIRKPAVIAASVSPIEAYRYEMGPNYGYKHKGKKITPISLAKEQIIRDKKKNVLTITSLVLTGVLLFGASSILSSINARDMALSGFSLGQFYIRIQDQELRENALETVESNSPFTEESYSALSQVSGVKQITTITNLPVSNDLNAKESNGAIVGFDETDMDLIRECNLGKSIPKYQEIASKNQIIIGRPSDFEEYFGIQPEVGNSIKLKVFDGTETKEMEFSIAAVLDESKIGNNGDKIDMLLLPNDSMKKITSSNMTYQWVIRVDEKMEQQAEKEIKQILVANPRLAVTTLSGAIAQNENFLQGMILALAVIIGFISCFAIMNLLNTIFTGVIVRQKEFALMRSVGMTQKQLTTMVCCEGLLIVSIGLILSLIVGGFIGYLLCALLKNGLMTYLNYQFPFSVTLLYCALVVICSLLVSEIALRHQKNMSLIELLRR
ncbi:MAG: ABC transporter permease [Lachnospiraceae bacterium]